MVSKPRFPKAADNARPYNSHRYDVFGPKIRRTLALYGRDRLDVWTLLEADPNVDAYCERPIVIADMRPKRVIDFWVRRNNREELWFLLRPDDCSTPEETAWLPSAFRTWAASQDLHLAPFDPVSLSDRKIFLDNWGHVIRYLAVNGKLVRAALVDQVYEATDRPRTLHGLEACFSSDDPILVRTAAFSLLHCGKFRCVDISLKPLGPDSVFEAA